MKRLIYITALTLLLVACKKDFLAKKPNKALLVPTTLTDFQSLLDNSNDVMNFVPVLNCYATDDIYMADDGFAAATPQEQNSYIWAADIYQGQTQQDWNRCYQQVLSANIVLAGLNNLSPDAAAMLQYNLVKGTALFVRAFAFYSLAQQFAPAYRLENANLTAGIPLRLQADIHIKTTRSTLQQTYEQILKDLQEAADLLPATVLYKTRPSSGAAYAMLARTTLTMQNYTAAENYATTATRLNPSLLDYNNLIKTANFPIPAALANTNPEILYYAAINFTTSLSYSVLTGVNPELYHSYQADDLRKVLYFNNNANGLYTFKGSYSGQVDLFGGIATDEIYLILAECRARANKTQEAMDVLNSLLEKRYDKATFKPLTAANPQEALAIVLEHRRKELVFRNTRWTDLRRLNLDPVFLKTITHMVKGIKYTLQPNSSRYTFPIPDDVIAVTGISQNNR